MSQLNSCSKALQRDRMVHSGDRYPPSPHPRGWSGLPFFPLERKLTFSLWIFYSEETLGFLRQWLCLPKYKWTLRANSLYLYHRPQAPEGAGQSKRERHREQREPGRGGWDGRREGGGSGVAEAVGGGERRREVRREEREVGRKLGGDREAACVEERGAKILA